MNTCKKAAGRRPAYRLILAVLCLGCLLLAGCSKAPDPVAITADNEEEGLYGYIDIELITDWFGAYEDDSLFWHVAGTPDGYLYVVAMDKSTFETDFKAAYDYNYDENEDTQPPAPARATGVLKPLDSELIEMGAEFMGWSEEEFTSQCGIYYLDLTTKPGR